MAGYARAAINLLRGRANTAVFAITTRCNCRCFMCGMHSKPPEEVGVEGFKRALRFMADHGFLMVYLTGGEPTLHPWIYEAIRYARRLDLLTVLSTNGTRGPEVVERLHEAGLDVLTVSIDHWDHEVCDKIRGVRGVLAEQVRSIVRARDLGMNMYALVYLNPYLVVDGVERLVEYVNGELKVPIGFCYPTDVEVNTYSLHGGFNEAELRERLKLSVRKLLKLKRRGYAVVNTATYLQDILRRPGAKPNYYCKGGENVFYVDWRGDVYPCFAKPKLFNLLRDEPRALRGVRCDECFTNCFREPSMLPQLLKSPKLLLKELAVARSMKGLLF
jgi:MoaA/NifB/PqqE/SkfB family radical SAM enzyme